MSDNTKFECLLYEMHRTILDFTDPGFEPLKRVNKMFYEFERMPHRVEAVAEVAMKIREEFDGFRCRRDVEVKDMRNMRKMVPYTILRSLGSGQYVAPWRPAVKAHA